MLRLINPTGNEYRLTVTYRDHDYTYLAKLIHSDFGLQSWMVWTRSKILYFEYNIYTKELKQELQHGEPGLPADFLQSIQEAFSK